MRATCVIFYADQAASHMMPRCVAPDPTIPRRPLPNRADICFSLWAHSCDRHAIARA